MSKRSIKDNLIAFCGNNKVQFNISENLTSSQELIPQPYSPIVRHATLPRFKRSVEILWRLLTDYLCIHKGSSVSRQVLYENCFQCRAHERRRNCQSSWDDWSKVQKRTCLPGRRFRRNLPAGRRLLEAYERGLQADSLKSWVEFLGPAGRKIKMKL